MNNDQTKRAGIEAGDVARAYTDGETLPDQLPTDPFGLFHEWFTEAQARGTQPNPNAMTLATVDGRGRPVARVVLCKDHSVEQGRVTFYTNYLGRKGRELAASPFAAAVFHWDHFDRQVRMEGPITRSPAAESDAYFATRRWESRLGAWASEQSEPIESRQALLDRVADAIVKLDLDLGAVMAAAEGGAPIVVPRPPHWGGFRLWAESVELWCGGTGRVHDRARWTRTLTRSAQALGGEVIDVYAGGPWRATRLQP